MSREGTAPFSPGDGWRWAFDLSARTLHSDRWRPLWLNLTEALLRHGTLNGDDIEAIAGS